jgi:DNA-binding LytR/AlgR family response regulator
LQTCLQSGNIGRYKHITNYGFIILNRQVIVNRSKIIRHGRDRTVTISTGHEFLVSREKWKGVKAELNRQLLIPFTKNDHPLNKKDGSSTQ